ncbi:MAG: TolC family protein [Methylorubrum rhodinum]|uniref:TolC family protein n=1 Tax=Methylorubrum rhodinum TaxID=29428 RepID=UPI003BAFF2BC
MATASTDQGSGARRSAWRTGATLLIGAVLLGTGTARPRAESIESVMGMALRSSFDRKADDERQAGVEAQLRGSYEAFLPTVGYAVNRRLDSKITYTPDIFTDPLAPSALDTVPRRQANEEGFLLTMPLFDGLRRFNDMQAARSAVAAGRGLQNDKAQQILLDTASAYLAVLRDRAIVRLREAGLADVRKVSRSVAVRREVHDATNAEAALAESRVTAAESALEQARANLATAEIELARLAGAGANPSQLPQVPNALLPNSAEELRGILLDSNGRLAAARLSADAAAYTARAAYSQFSPQLNLVFTHARRGIVSNTPYKVQDTTTLLQALIPIYQPGAFSNLSREHAVARQKDYEALDLERALLAQATAAFHQRRSTIQQVAQAEQRVRKIARAVQGRQMELRLGSMTTVDVLNTVAELAEARIAKINLEFARDRATYALAAAMNRLRA